VLDDARPHTTAATVNHIATFSWERLAHAPYSPDLARSDFHFFLTSKRAIEKRRFITHEDVEAAVRTQGADFYQNGFFKLVKRRDTCVIVDGDNFEKWPTNAPFRPHRCVSLPCRFLQMAD
jgi:hypothetical protein